MLLSVRGPAAAHVRAPQRMCSWNIMGLYSSLSAGRESKTKTVSCPANSKQAANYQQQLHELSTCSPLSFRFPSLVHTHAGVWRGTGRSLTCAFIMFTVSSNQLKMLLKHALMPQHEEDTVTLTEWTHLSSIKQVNTLICYFKELYSFTNDNFSYYFILSNWIKMYPVYNRPEDGGQELGRCLLLIPSSLFTWNGQFHGKPVSLISWSLTIQNNLKTKVLFTGAATVKPFRIFQQTVSTQMFISG